VSKLAGPADAEAGDQVQPVSPDGGAGGKADFIIQRLEFGGIGLNVLAKVV